MKHDNGGLRPSQEHNPSPPCSTSASPQVLVPPMILYIHLPWPGGVMGLTASGFSLDFSPLPSPPSWYTPASGRGCFFFTPSRLPVLFSMFGAGDVAKTCEVGSLRPRDPSVIMIEEPSCVGHCPGLFGSPIFSFLSEGGLVRP